MRSFTFFTGVLACAASVAAQACTAANVVAALPVISGLTINPSSATANMVYNYSVTGSNMQPNALFSFCNVTYTYAHVDKGDRITLQFWLPASGNFKNRYLSSGGGGEAINSGNAGLAMGVPYGAVTGQTDGGLTPVDNFYTVFLYANNSINYEEMYMFAYVAHHELAIAGKAFTRNFFSMESNTKLYSYYQACSEGGREGMSQVQRFEDQFDGSIIGAPAFRYAFQQIQHLYAGVVEQTMDHYPAPCVFNYLVNQTIIACDPLDGFTDGVVARTDLCMLNYDISVLVGKSYSCAATSRAPAANGTISKQDIAVAKKILDGFKDTSGKRVYFNYQPSAAFTDAQTSYNATSGTYYAPPSGIGGEWVEQVLNEQELTNLPSLAGVTYDTLRDWCNDGLRKYYSDLHTAWPDLTPYYSGGSKIIHYHGESDYSIPTASSVRFFESVRKIMYPNLSMTAGAAALSQWYKLFLVPGGSHCAPNTAEPNGPWPQTNLAVMINWVEDNVEPTTLNATHLAGSMVGQNAQICAWPNRPLYSNNGTTMECVFDQKSYETWIYTLDAILMPVY